MNRTRSLPLLVALAAVLVSGAAQAQSIGSRWSLPSLLTPAEAARVLARRAAGEPVAPGTLFEAEKHLRTDRSFSSGHYVVRAAMETLLEDAFEGSGLEVRIRFPDPVLQWLDSLRYVDAGGEVVRLRGESLALGVVNVNPNLAAVYAWHLTIHKEWRLCGGAPCQTRVEAPLRENVAYELAVPLDSTAPGDAATSGILLAAGHEGHVFFQTFPDGDASGAVGRSCDPLPSLVRFTGPGVLSPARMSLRHEAARTEDARDNHVACAFFAIPGPHPSRFTYFVSDAVADAPGPSVSRNNPAELALYER